MRNDTLEKLLSRHKFVREQCKNLMHMIKNMEATPGAEKVRVSGGRFTLGIPWTELRSSMEHYRDKLEAELERLEHKIDAINALLEGDNHEDQGP